MAGRNLFDHPEVEKLLQEIFIGLPREADRGAVLVGTEYVDRYLRKLFDVLMPDISKYNSNERNRLKNVVGRSGIINSFGTRVYVAYILRLIPQNLYDSLQALRSLRNLAGHPEGAFQLNQHRDTLRKIYDLKPKVPDSISRLSFIMVLNRYISAALNIKIDNEQIFNTPEEAIEYLRNNSSVTDMISEPLPKYELSWGIMFLCAFLIHEADIISKLMGANDTISKLTRRTSDRLDQT